MKYAEAMRQNFIQFLSTRTIHDLMELYRYAWMVDGSFDTDGVIFRTFEDMADGDAEEFREFVCDIVKSGDEIYDDPDTYYTHTVYGYRPADEDALYDKANITALADWLVGCQSHCFPLWLFVDIEDIGSIFDIERYCRIIAKHI